MVRFSVITGSAAVRSYRQDGASSRVSPLAAAPMAAASEAALQGTATMAGATASAGAADVRTPAAAAPAATIAAILANFGCIFAWLLLAGKWRGKQRCR